MCERNNGGPGSSIDFRPEMGPAVRAFKPQDLIARRITISPEFVAKTWGPEAADEYRRQSMSPTRERRRLIDIA